MLIIGSGVIGTIYGWAIKESGGDVTHYIRTGTSGRLSSGVSIDILDERKGFKKYNRTTYPIRAIETIGPDEYYDLVIVPVNWYQIEGVLKTIVPACPQSFYYIVTSNWAGTGVFDQYLRRDQYILGYPDAGGTIRNGCYWTNIGPEIHIASPTEENLPGFHLIRTLFEKAHITLDVQENMLHWLWVHTAGSIGIWAALQKYGKIDRLLGDRALLKKSFLATRECLRLCEKRGAFSRDYPEISAFQWPLWFLIPMFRLNMRFNESMKRYTAHAESAPIEDLKANYRDVLKTAEEMNFDMPHFRELGIYLG